MYPQEYRYTKTHEWAKVEGDRVRVGVTNYAQEHLGDIVFVELPQIGRAVKQGEGFAVVESVKAVSDCYAPVSGEVVEVNQTVADKPETVNQDPHGEGWMAVIRMSDPRELDNLMDAAAYEKHCAEEASH